MHINRTRIFRKQKRLCSLGRLCSYTGVSWPKVSIRLKGENSVAMGTAHRLVAEAAPSLKDLHKLRSFFLYERECLRTFGAMHTGETTD